MHLDQINHQMRSILTSDDEKIIYRPFLTHKIKPKNLMGLFQSKWRYLMFSNKYLYTLDPKCYETANIDQDKLVINRIDIEYLSHLIFMPDFHFEAYELFDLEKVPNIRQSLLNEMSQKKCQVIIGFNDKNFGKFRESDIALETNMFVVL